MSEIINIKIDLSKIDKSKIFNGKNGAKYIDFDVVANRDGADKFGNTHFVRQSQTREERLSKAKVNYVGNGKSVSFGKKAAQGNDDDWDW